MYVCNVHACVWANVCGRVGYTCVLACAWVYVRANAPLWAGGRAGACIRVLVCMQWLFACPYMSGEVYCEIVLK